MSRPSPWGRIRYTPRMRRLGLFVGIWLACGLLIAATVQAGRAIEAPIVFAQIGGTTPDRLRYMLVDAQRGQTLTRQIILPTGYDIAWQDGAVVMLELGRRLELADWTFSVLDTVTGERQPVLRVTTANTVQMRITGVRPAPCRRWLLRHAVRPVHRRRMGVVTRRAGRGEAGDGHAGPDTTAGVVARPVDAGD
ncbi:MAG: hypothetical protein IPM16_14970 [Chloroflexi bacterium]|nr:hypothetical protein [Chloroflexota bacterium]